MKDKYKHIRKRLFALFDEKYSLEKEMVDEVDALVKLPDDDDTTILDWTVYWSIIRRRLDQKVFSWRKIDAEIKFVMEGI
jgi:hypothetical protein